MWRPERLQALQLAARAAVGASLSFAIAQAINLDRPIFACLAAVVVTDLTPAETRALGLRRMGAMLLGALTDAFAIGIGVIIAIPLSEALMGRDGSKIAGYICGLIVWDSGTAPWHYGLYRLFETGLGIMVAWLISYVPKLIRIEQADGEGPA